jgi:hypothetical protein
MASTSTTWKNSPNGPRFLPVGQVSVGTVASTSVACMSSPDAVEDFFRACSKGRAAALPEWLSSSGGDCLSWINSQGQGCIEVACLGGAGNVKMVEALLEADAPIRENLLTETWPLHCAAFHGAVEMVAVLMRYGGFGQLYTPNRFNELPLHFACMSGSKKVVEKVSVVHCAGWSGRATAWDVRASVSPSEVRVADTSQRPCCLPAGIAA